VHLFLLMMHYIYTTHCYGSLFLSIAMLFMQRWGSLCGLHGDLAIGQVMKAESRQLHPPQRTKGAHRAKWGDFYHVI
jgi:hypothetical protein